VSTPLPALAAGQFSGHADAGVPVGLPRLLQRIPPHGAMSLTEHLAVHGPLATWRKRSRGSEHPLIDVVEHAGLRGRGGAGFPTALKLRAVAAARRRAIVVVNAAEGEPASHKDRTLAASLPHLVLDGATLAAQALGTQEVVVGVCESARTSVEGLALAVAERGPTRHNPARVRLRTVPGHYVAGQESALVNYLNGARAIPTFTPPLPSQQGVARRPTLLSNAETFAHMALIARHGPDWFRELGTPAQPGSTLVTLSGPVARPGVYEIEHGASLASLVNAAGGTTARLRAALIGGYGGAWIAAEHLSGLALSDEHLDAYGATLGAGVVLLLSEHACPVAETARVLRWLARQSAGQCGPCVHGLDALALAFEEAAGGAAHPDGERRIARLATLVNGRGACGHPDGAARLARSAIDAFAAELDAHARRGPCERCRTAGELPLPAGGAAR
jgi:NADH:ubiquinone oxidoreductase subunit F (NADH-binding)